MKQFPWRIVALVMLALMALILVPAPAQAARAPQSVTVNTTLPTWGGVNVTLEVTTTAGTFDFEDDWASTSYRYNGTGAWTCMDHADYLVAGTHQETFSIPVPTTPGPYTLNMRAHILGGCLFGDEAFPDTPITVAANNPAFPAACGIDMTLILDESGSIVGTGAGTSDISANVRSGANDLWNALLGTGSTMSVVEFNTEGRVVAALQDVPVVPSNTAAFTTYISGAGATPDARYEPEDYTTAGNTACDNDACYTNWQDAFLKAVGINSPAKTLAVFFTDGVPTTNNDFPTTADPVANVNTGASYPHVGDAALAANTLKSQGTRVLGVGIANGSSPTTWLPNISGPTAFAGDVATADYTTTTSGDFGDALRAIVLEACQASVTVNKTVKNDLGVYVLADGWEFTATASPTGTPFQWTAPAVSTNASISALTGSGSNGTGSLLFQWEPESPVTDTTISIDETLQSGHTFVDVTCQNNTTQQTIIDGQTTLPVSFDVGAEEFVVCEFRNDPPPTAVSLGSISAAAPPSAAPAAGLLLVLALATALAALGRRRA